MANVNTAATSTDLTAAITAFRTTVQTWAEWVRKSAAHEDTMVRLALEKEGRAGHELHFDSNLRRYEKAVWREGRVGQEWRWERVERGVGGPFASYLGTGELLPSGTWAPGDRLSEEGDEGWEYPRYGTSTLRYYRMCQEVTARGVAVADRLLAIPLAELERWTRFRGMAPVDEKGRRYDTDEDWPALQGLAGIDRPISQRGLEIPDHGSLVAGVHALCDAPKGLKREYWF